MRIANKRGQSMQMPFQMIFSLFLIAVFLVVAFFVIRHFLSIQECSQVGLFYRDLQDKITSIWNAQEAEQTFEGTLPSSVKYACFLNFSRGKILTGLNGEQRETADRIYDELAVYYRYKTANFFLYPSGNTCDMPSRLLEHLDTGTASNPYCVENKGKVKIRLYKGFNDFSVKVRQ